jgi:hypothetical protein
VSESGMPVEGDGLREVVLAGPGSGRGGGDRAAVLAVLASGEDVGAAVAQVGVAPTRRCALSAQVTAVVVLGLCLFCSQGCPAVLARLWPLLPGLDPALVMRSTVTAAAVSKARARLPAAVLRAVFEAGVRAWAGSGAIRLFGRVVVAVDGTVVDLPRGGTNHERFKVPTGGRFPQARLVTLVCCGTRRVLAAAFDSAAVSEQALWDRLTDRLRPGMLLLGDRNFFSMNRWRAAAETGADLVWRVKNGARSLPVNHQRSQTLPDGSVLVVLRESDAMLSARRKATGQKRAPRLSEITARLIEFTITTTDQAGRSTPSRFRVLTTLLDPDAYPAVEIARCYSRRWEAETTYRMIKTVLRGSGRRLRATTPDQAEQEAWALLTIHNALVDQAVTAAVDLGTEATAISYTAVLAALRDHLAPPCRACGHHPDTGQLTAAITAAPRNRTDRTRTSPRTAQQRQTQHTRDVTHTITITNHTATPPETTSSTFS